ncbi:hypothetical protein ACVI1K_007836 [Bradyrhizobium sp. USDA 4508]|nr:hypothetical protein [Bradyrhizobium sp. USDA 4541]
MLESSRPTSLRISIRGLTPLSLADAVHLRLNATLSRTRFHGNSVCGGTLFHDPHLDAGSTDRRRQPPSRRLQISPRAPSRVPLPQPDGPRMQTSSLGVTVKSKSRTVSKLSARSPSEMESSPTSLRLTSCAGMSDIRSFILRHRRTPPRHQTLPERCQESAAAHTGHARDSGLSHHLPPCRHIERLRHAHRAWDYGANFRARSTETKPPSIPSIRHPC